MFNFAVLPIYPRMYVSRYMIFNKFLLNLVISWFTTSTSQYVMSVKILIVIILHRPKLHKFVIECFKGTSEKERNLFLFNCRLSCFTVAKTDKIIKSLKILQLCRTEHATHSLKFSN